MIEIRIASNSIHMTGHACRKGADGIDRVCAGVSALTCNLINSLRDLTGDRIRADTGSGMTIIEWEKLVSDTTMTKELEFIQKTYGIRDDEILCLMKNAADVAFATDSVKDKLYRIMREVYGA